MPWNVKHWDLVCTKKNRLQPAHPSERGTISILKFFGTLVFLWQVYKAWVNSYLADCGAKSKINDLAEDLKDGIILCQLIKLTTGHETGQSEEVQ